MDGMKGREEAIWDGRGGGMDGGGGRGREGVEGEGVVGVGGDGGGGKVEERNQLRSFN